MKKISILLFVLLSTNYIYSQNNYVLYKNEKFNYKIIIPGTWEKVDLNLKYKSIMYSSKDKNTEIKVRAFKSSDKDIDKITSETKWDLRSIDPRLNKIIETKNIEIKKNITGKLIVFEYRSNRRNILKRVMIIKDANTIYIIECKSTIKRFYKFDNIFTTALSSFSFLSESEDKEIEEEGHDSKDRDKNSGEDKKEEDEI